MCALSTLVSDFQVTHATVQTLRGQRVGFGSADWLQRNRWPGIEIRKVTNQARLLLTEADNRLQPALSRSIAPELLRHKILLWLNEGLDEDAGRLPTALTFEVPDLSGGLRGLTVRINGRGVLLLADVARRVVEWPEPSNLPSGVSEEITGSARPRELDPEGWVRLAELWSVFAQPQFVSRSIASLHRQTRAVNPDLAATLTGIASHLANCHRKSVTNVLELVWRCPVDRIISTKPALTKFVYVRDLLKVANVGDVATATRRLQGTHAFRLLDEIAAPNHVPHKSLFSSLGEALLDAIDKGGSPIQQLVELTGISRRTARLYLKLPLEAAFADEADCFPETTSPLPPLLALLSRMAIRQSPQTVCEMHQLARILSMLPFTPLLIINALLLTGERQQWTNAHDHLDAYAGDLRWLPDYQNWRSQLRARLQIVMGQNESCVDTPLDLVQLIRTTRGWREAERWAQAKFSPLVGHAPSDWPPLLSRIAAMNGRKLHCLNDFAALQADARHMHHCIESYEERCRTGQSHILSLRDGLRRVATIEIRLIRGSSLSSRADFRMVAAAGRNNSRVDVNTLAAIKAFCRSLGCERQNLVNPEIFTWDYAERHRNRGTCKPAASLDHLFSGLRQAPELTLQRYRQAICPSRRKSPIFRQLSSHWPRLLKAEPNADWCLERGSN